MYLQDHLGRTEAVTSQHQHHSQQLQDELTTCALVRNAYRTGIVSGVQLTCVLSNSHGDAIESACTGL